ncbi:A/G-specific adenine glycosylase [Desulfovibrio sp. X2]|uniref:A/G-specific adenine glycosylase n=1 Tax=Desulfovibrio sp. X2 TaxID=941449 RepID=UPI000358A219|nr:A/G-specific adenine glycosylase [Desulfovibrio sp. X2]EPR38732.1 A/G-specific adenine glycosylase [Desulfovibrio sp. X2]
MDLSAIAAALLDWFGQSARALPWRKSYDPYQVWLSEIMLQQTQMDRAVGYFERFLGRFPDVSALAAADEEEVLKLWEGLGYYSRARNLLACARELDSHHGGRLPDDPAALAKLPGIGPYTAGAIAAIAYGRDVPAVDANVERVFARLFDLDLPPKEPKTHAFIVKTAQDLIPPGRARELNQALMELGALVCLPKRPRCSECPVSAFCEAFRLDLVFERPVPAKAVDYIPMDVASGLLLREGMIYIQKRPAQGVWAGLWEFPGGTVESGETPAEAVVREFREETGLDVAVTSKLAVVRHGYTRYRVALHCYALTSLSGAAEPALHAAQEGRWVDLAGLDAFAFPAGHKKLIDRLGRDIRLDTLWG